LDEELALDDGSVVVDDDGGVVVDDDDGGVFVEVLG
jgi:hypothetical protein